MVVRSKTPIVTDELERGHEPEHQHQKKYRLHPVTFVRRMRQKIASPEMVNSISESAQNIATTSPPSPKASPLCRRLMNGLST